MDDTTLVAVIIFLVALINLGIVLVLGCLGGED